MFGNLQEKIGSTMEKVMIDRYMNQLDSAKGQCLRALLDYSDALEENEPDRKVVATIEKIKKRLHNDIPALHQRVSNLLLLALMDGEIQPFSNGDK